MGEEKLPALAVKVLKYEPETSSEIALESYEISSKDNPTLNLEAPVSASFLVSQDLI